VQFVIAAIIGLAIALLLWGLREEAMRRFARDAEWVRQASLRFNPEPINAEARTLAIYIAYLLLLLILLYFTPAPLIALALWAMLLPLPKLLLEMAWQRRKQKIDQQLPAAIAAMCNSMKAGLTLVQALQRLAEQAPEPIRTDFRIMANQYAFGADLEATINEAKHRLQLANFNLFASALLLNREMGGDVSETLNRISISLDKLKQMRQTVEAHTSEGRTNIKVLLVAPIFMLLLIATIDYEGVMMLFTTVQGYAVLLIAALLFGLGIYFAAKITRTEV
jgi:tight adherence protein B